MLEGLGLTDYHLDNLIDRIVRPIIMEVRYKQYERDYSRMADSYSRHASTTTWDSMYGYLDGGVRTTGDTMRYDERNCLFDKQRK